MKQKPQYRIHVDCTGASDKTWGACIDYFMDRYGMAFGVVHGCINTALAEARLAAVKFQCPVEVEELHSQKMHDLKKGECYVYNVYPKFSGRL